MRLFPFTAGFFTMLLLGGLTGCTQAQVRSPETGKPDSILVIYLSRTNNTKALAEYIHRQLGGKLVALELEKPYPADYRSTVEQVAEENRTGYLPPLANPVKDISSYSVVFIGFPTWGMQLPPPVKSFLKSHDLSGKKVIPFNTNAGYGTGSSFDTVKELCKGCTVLPGYSTKGGIERDGILFTMEGERAVAVQQEMDRWLSNLPIRKTR